LFFINFMNKKTDKKTKTKNKTTAIDKLAILVVNGFQDMENKFENKFEALENKMDQGFQYLENKMNVGFKNVNEKFDHFHARMSYLERDVAEIREKVIPKDEFEDLESRVKYCEIKLKIESGK